MGENEPITMRDIARMAGVSTGTVSRVHNGRPGVGPTTRQHVQRLIEEHDFRANASAKQLSTGRSGAIGVIFPLHASQVVMHPIYPALLAGLGDAAETHGYDLMLLTATFPGSIGHLRDTIGRRRVEGVVLPAAGARDRLLQEVLATSIPTVLIGHRARHASVGWVDCTHDVAASELTSIMIQGGRRELVMLNGPDSVSACRLRSAGFWKAVHAAASDVRWASEFQVPFDTDTARQTAMVILSAQPRPSGIVAGNDLIALGVLQAARELGISVPGELAVSGFDDRSFAASTSPPLSTARMPLPEIGEAAAEMLFAMIEGQPLARRHLILPTQVMVRESTFSAEPGSLPAEPPVAVPFDEPGRLVSAVRTLGPAPRFRGSPP